MPAPSSDRLTLSLTPAEQWTLHHALLERVDREHTATDAANVDPPPLAVYAAFDTLDSGGTQFSVRELEACLDVLSDSHHRPDWCAERDRLEGLLRKLTRTLEQHQPAVGLERGLADD